MKKVFIWNGVNLAGLSLNGVISGKSQTDITKELMNKGVYQLELIPIPLIEIKTQLDNSKIVILLNSLSMLLNSGLSLNEALKLLRNDQRGNIYQYIFRSLYEKLQQGASLENAFRELGKLFPEIFISMIIIAEKSGKLCQGLELLKDYFEKKEFRNKELKKLTRYPLLVFSFSLIIATGLIVFVVPMFKSIYALSSGELPFLTKLIVKISGFLRFNSLEILMGILLIYLWHRIPHLKDLSPFSMILNFIRKQLDKREDPLIYAHSMSILLTSGLDAHSAELIATDCMSKGNRKFGLKVRELLQSGVGFAESFKKVKWFPQIYQLYLVSAEEAGHLNLGFEQLYNFLKSRREEHFSKFSQLIEPIMMIVIGFIVLIILLAIYLPIFDLGNQVG